MLSSRVYIEEKMDNFNPEILGERAILDDSLNNLSFINKFLGNTSVTLEAVKKILNKDVDKIFNIVDLGCGGGDNLRAIAQWCFDNNRAVKLTGIDGNPHILMYAEQQESNLNIKYKQVDVLDAQFEMEPCDILISSHFIYRFTDDELVNFINKAAKKVSNAIIFSELQRNIIPYYAFRIFGRLITFNDMTVQDGQKAITSSFKKEELLNVLKQLNVKSYQLKWKWVFRYLVIIRI